MLPLFAEHGFCLNPILFDSVVAAICSSFVLQRVENNGQRLDNLGELMWLHGTLPKINLSLFNDIFHYLLVDFLGNIVICSHINCSAVFLSIEFVGITLMSRISIKRVQERSNPVTLEAKSHLQIKRLNIVHKICIVSQAVPSSCWSHICFG